MGLWSSWGFTPFTFSYFFCFFFCSRCYLINLIGVFFFWISFLFSLVLIYKMTERNLWQFVWCQSDYIKYWLYQLLLSAFFVPINLSLMTVTCHSIQALHYFAAPLAPLLHCVLLSWVSNRFSQPKESFYILFFSPLKWDHQGWLTDFLFFFFLLSFSQLACTWT